MAAAYKTRLSAITSEEDVNILFYSKNTSYSTEYIFTPNGEVSAYDIIREIVDNVLSVDDGFYDFRIHIASFTLSGQVEIALEEVTGFSFADNPALSYN